MHRHAPSAALRPGLIYAACAVLLLAVSFLAPLDHDEGQYVGAVALMPRGLPYRDFAYLQTPLQPLLFAPLAFIAKGWLFPALRAVNALLAAGAVAGLWLAARRAGASARGAAIGAAALLCSHMLLFAASVARNDALPLMLMTAGLALILPVAKGGGRWSLALMAGIAQGAAASAKISYGLPALAAGLFALLHWRTVGAMNVALLALGGLIGGAPTFWLLHLAPDAAWFGIVDYSLKAPVEWRTLNDQAFMLDTPLSLARLMRFLAQGCGLIALGAVVAVAGRRRTTTQRLLDMMIVAGLVAAWLPRPIYVQYLGPLLPALFVRFALLVDAPFWCGRAGRTLIGIGLIAGVVEMALAVGGNLIARQSPVMQVMGDARAMDRAMSGREGRIVTLTPARVVDTLLPLDRRFVTGPFLFRTRAVLTLREANAFHVTTWRSFAADMDRSPPTAFLIGGESLPGPLTPRGLDDRLERWALAHGYRAVRLPSGTGALLLRPHPSLTQK